MERRTPVNRRRWLPPLLALLLLVQTLGLLHRVLHAPGRHAVAHVTAQSGGAASPFGHDDGDLQCQLYDQLAHADLAFGAAPVLAVIVPAHAREGVPPAGRLAPQAAGFLARGPPSLTA